MAQNLSGRDRAHWLKEEIEEAFVDPAPSMPIRDVFRRLRAYHAEQVKADTESNTQRSDREPKPIGRS
jgi:hypothetical protein